MFLFTLIILPLLSYFIFNIYKSDYKESNWVVKMIWILWLLILIIIITSEIFHRRDSYLVITLIWYLAVFLYYFILSFKLQLKNISKIKYTKITLSGALIKLFYMICLFIFFINVVDDSRVINKLNIFRHSSDWHINFVFVFFATILLSWLIYELIDMIKNNIFRKILDNRTMKTKLKRELKREILKELKS